MKKDAAELVYLDINLITAALLISGQITIDGVFIRPSGGFSIPLQGPITGGSRIAGKSNSKILTSIVDAIDLFIALLLIFGQISVRGTLIGSGYFSIVVSGPIFGVPKTEVTKETKKQFFDHLETYLNPNRQ